ncbi:MAG TPA: hypothetical protein VFT74_00430 [Isosphaeraceae bacterium]|nr:hypothetical protein [Isosphaeraceae bacterium]
MTYLYILPLAVAISLVYAASRHEDWRRIGKRALRVCPMILVLLLVTTLILYLVNSFV